MIDFNKKILNSDKFRQPAIQFEKYGYYCSYPKGTTEYIKFWEEEQRKCVNGYVAEDGEFVTGYHYFYLNYCPIDRVVEREVMYKNKKIVKKIKEKAFPKFYDYDYYYFMSIEEAEENNEHMIVLKARRKGYSWKGGAMLNRNFYLIPNSKSYAFAGEKEFLTKDGLLTKAWDMMGFLDEHTAWGKKRQVVNTSMHKRASYMTTDAMGNKIEGGYKSEIIGVTLKGDINKLRGKVGKLMLFEEAGKLRGLKEAWIIAKSSVEQDGQSYGLMCAYGTGGEEGADFESMKEMFYNTKIYKIKSFDNIWEENVFGTKCGFFVPDYANLDNELEGRSLMDKDGNTNLELAKKFVLLQREPILAEAKDKNTIDRYCAEHPISPSEAILQISGNIFPKKELQSQLALVRNNKKLSNLKQIGDLDFVSGKPIWTPKKHGDITRFPLGKTDDPKGSIVIWEHPVENPPYGMYIAGLDPYDHDQSGTNSLGALFIYKRSQGIEQYGDTIVAEYTGRPSTAEEYYENTRKLLMYYNAKLLYENERKGIFVYFTQKHCEYMLCDQPNELIRDIVGDSKVQRNKGIHMNKQIKEYGEGLIKEWLLEEFDLGKKNLSRILSEPLLEELISYNDEGNFDRVMALMMVVLYRQQLHNIRVKERKDSDTKYKSLFSTPIFGNSLGLNEDILYNN